MPEEWYKISSMAKYNIRNPVVLSASGKMSGRNGNYAQPLLHTEIYGCSWKKEFMTEWDGRHIRDLRLRAKEL